MRQLLECGSLLPLFKKEQMASSVAIHICHAAGIDFQSAESCRNRERFVRCVGGAGTDDSVRTDFRLPILTASLFLHGMAWMLDSLAKMDAHHRLLLGFIVAAVVGLALRTHALWTASLATYDAFAFAILGLIWVTVAQTPRERIRAVAQRQDVGRTVIFMFVITVACAALFAVAFLIRTGKPAERHLSIHLVLALAAVVLSWLLMHAVFGLRYAHKFYDDSVISTAKHAGGLKFPEDDLPDYRDFTYFSFVIGMTCQVSDVSVTSRQMRRLVLLHGILSFGFNTVILALTINTVSSFL